MTTTAGSTHAPARRGPRVGSVGWPSPFRQPQSTRRGPFLDPREIVIGAIAVGPHRQHERTIGLVLVFEFADQRLELRPRIVGGSVGMLRRIARSDLELQRPFLARRVVAGEADIDQFSDGGAGIDTLKAALAQDRGLQR